MDAQAQRVAQRSPGLHSICPPASQAQSGQDGHVPPGSDAAIAAD